MENGPQCSGLMPENKPNSMVHHCLKQEHLKAAGSLLGIEKPAIEPVLRQFNPIHTLTFYLNSIGLLNCGKPRAFFISCMLHVSLITSLVQSERLVLYLRIRTVHGSNPEPRDRLSWLTDGLRGFPPSFQTYRKNVLKLSHDHFLPYPFQFVINQWSLSFDGI
jgi:hypothetical protein